MALRLLMREGPAFLAPTIASLLSMGLAGATPLGDGLGAGGALPLFTGEMLRAGPAGCLAPALDPDDATEEACDGGLLPPGPATLPARLAGLGTSLRGGGSS